MQKEYISINDPNINNGKYLLAAFKIIPAEGKTLEDVSSEVAAESSTGSNVKIGSSTPFSSSLNALVYEIDEVNQIVKIAYPWEIFDSDGNVQNILTFIVGNILGMSEVKGCKLIDVYFPTQMLEMYDGPSYTIDDMREYLNVYDSPILGTIIKPKIGLTSTEYAELCYDFWIGGGHFVKNDEPQANQSFSPYDKMVISVKEVMDKVEYETGRKVVHSFNVSSADLDIMIRRCDLVVDMMEAGSYAFLIDGITSGWTAVQTLRRRYPNVFLHFHRAAHGAFTRPENPFGFSVDVLTKFARLAGASGIHTGTAGVGKMSGDSKIDIQASRHALNISSKGDYFEQVWSKIPSRDDDIKNMVNVENKIYELGTKAMSKLGEERIVKYDKWRVIKKTCPIISGGLNPILFPKFLDVMGTIDFITTMGGGIHSHPMGTTAGAKAFIQAYEAWRNGIDLYEYAKDHKELASAIVFYSNGNENEMKFRGNESV